MTRIVAGELGGRRLAVPSGRATRPTSDRVREAMFNSLETMLDLAAARVADLYAGSGALGFEAISRGAGHVLFVESDARAVAALRRNIRGLGVAATARLAAAPVDRVLSQSGTGAYDLILADPPYSLSDDKLALVLTGLGTGGWLTDEAVLVVERSTRSGAPPWGAEVEPIRSRRYGETTLWYGRRS